MDHPTAVAAMPADVPQQAPPPAPGLRDRLHQLVFGDDIFISYSRADASGYALALADGLTKLGFSCFLDQWGTESREDLPEGLKAALRASGALVVIASPGAVQSRWIADEIELFRGLQRPILPISIDGAEQEAKWRAHVVGLATTRDTRDRLADADPDPRVMTRIRNALEFRKRRYRLRRAFWVTAGATVLLLASSLFAVLRASASVARANNEVKAALAEAGQARTQAAQDSLEAVQARAAAQKDSAAAEESLRLKQAADRQVILAKDSLEEVQGSLVAAQVEMTRAQARASAELRRATSIQFTSEATRILASNPARALRLALQAVDTEENIHSRRVLAAALRQHPRLLHIVTDPGRHLGYSIAFSPDGSRLAIGMSDGRVRLWNLHDRRELLADSIHLPPEGEQTLGMPVAFSPDGRWLASGGDEGKLMLWRADNGRRADSMQLEAPVSVMAFSRDGLLAVGSPYGGKIPLLRIRAEGRLEPPSTIDIGEARNVYALAFSATGDTIVAGGYQALYVIDAAQRVLRDSLVTASYSRMISVAFSPDGAVLAAADGEVVRQWYTADLRPVPDGEEPIRGVSVAFGGERVVTGTYTGVIHTWKRNEEGGWMVEDTLAKYPDETYSLAINSAGTMAASANGDGTVTLWAVDAPRRIEWDVPPAGRGADEPAPYDRLHVAAMDRGGRQLLLGDTAGLRLQDMRTGDALSLSLPGVSAAALHPSGDAVLAGTRDGRLLVWRRGSPGPVKLDTLPLQVPAPVSIVLSADGHVAAVSDTAGRVVLVRVEEKSRHADRRAESHARSIQLPGAAAGGILAISPDNRRVLTGDLILMDVNGGRVRQVELPLDDTQARAAVFKDGGREVLALLRGGEIVLWRPDEGSRGEIVDSVVSENPNLRTKEVLDAAFSHDGRYLAVEFSEDPPMVWDLETRTALFTGRAPYLLNPDIAFSSNGSTLVVSDDGVIRHLDLSLASWRRSACSILGLATRPGDSVAPGCEPVR